MTLKIYSGGQSGADQAGLRAAKRFGLPTGGWIPKGFLTEFGPRPDFAVLYGLRETSSSQYPPRTLMNVEVAEATLWFGTGDTAGYACTKNACIRADRPFYPMTTDGDMAESMSALIQEMKYGSLNIAGNRESKSRGIGREVERFLCRMFRLLGIVEVNAFVLGQRVRAVDDVYEQPTGDSPGGYCARRGDLLIVRGDQPGDTWDYSVSHEYRRDNSFGVHHDEIRTETEKESRS